MPPRAKGSDGPRKPRSGTQAPGIVRLYGSARDEIRFDMPPLTYNPDVFRVRNESHARQIILTAEGGQSTNERWVRETPYLGSLLSDRLNVSKGQLVIDFGCGIGRISRELIERLGCRVLGVDISADMRAMAPRYVESEDFSVVSLRIFSAMVDDGLQAHAAISVWVLQHCLAPAIDIDLIRRSVRPGGRVGIVNNKQRAVPTKEKAWTNDGVDVRKLLDERLSEIEAGVLDEAIVSHDVSAFGFWAIYERDPQLQTGARLND